MERLLVIGAGGQLGTELVEELQKLYGKENVIASDIRPSNFFDLFEVLDITDNQSFRSVLKKHKITQVYHLAAVLSAKAEQNPAWSWNLNMNSLLNVLEAAKDGLIDKIFWPSSIAVFGPDTPRDLTPQHTIMSPSTVYGISKLAGERWCEYYFNKYGVDVRSIRYPGLIGYKSMPGGGTTDYAVEIFHEALAKGSYTSFLSAGTYLPMMYMPDAIMATIQLMEADKDKIKVRSSYNLAGISFSPDELGQEIKKHLPTFELNYAPDYRQKIADSWPKSIDDSSAKKDWGWKCNYNLAKMTVDMLENLKSKKHVASH